MTRIDTWNELWQRRLFPERTRVNYILENLQLLTTGVSSPIKGGRLCKKRTKRQPENRLPQISTGISSGKS